jgi:hypothetical protein
MEKSMPTAESITDLVTEATLAYARAVEEAGTELPPLRPEVSTTDAITLACALLRSQNLNPFDLALWFSRKSGPQ